MTGIALTLLACAGDADSDILSSFPGCQAYLDCVAAAMPEELLVAEASYGETGVCWGQGEDYDQLCEASCEASLLEASHSHLTVAECEPIDGWVPRDGCPFAESDYSATLTDAGGDCFEPGFLGEALPTELFCTDATRGEFDFFIEGLFSVPLSCVTAAYDFTCDDPALTLKGTFAHTEDAAAGTLVIEDTDCGAGASWSLTR